MTAISMNGVRVTPARLQAGARPIGRRPIFLGGVVRSGLVRLATILTSVGRAITTGRLLGGLGAGVPGAAQPSFVSWGTGAGTAAIADTTLFTEAVSTTLVTGNASRTVGTATQQTTTTTNDTLQVLATLTAAAGGAAITNAGLFDAAGTSGGPAVPPSGGNLYMKGDFAVINLAAGDSIAFTAKVQYQ